MSIFSDIDEYGQRHALPESVDELVDYLDAIYPDACVSPGETLVDASRRAGARDVVQHLRDLQKNGDPPI